MEYICIIICKNYVNLFKILQSYNDLKLWLIS